MEKEEELYSNIEELKTLFSRIENSKKLNEEVTDDQNFSLVNGEKIKSINGLSNALKSMSYEVFTYHVNDNKNDFADWIHFAYNHKSLANEIRNAKTKTQIISITEKLL